MATKIEFNLADVESLASKGMTEQQIAISLGVSRATISRRKRDCDAFDTSYRKGQISGIQKVKNALFESATHSEKPNVLAMKTFLERVEGPARLEIKGDIEINDSHRVDEAIKALEAAGININDI